MNILEVYDKLQFGSNSHLCIDFVGRGNVWINNTYDLSVTKLARQIIFEAIHNTAPGQLSIIGYDSDLSGVLAPFSTLSSGETTVELRDNGAQSPKYSIWVNGELKEISDDLDFMIRTYDSKYH